MVKSWRVWHPFKRLFGQSRLEVPADEQMARVEKAIARLPERTREVFLMHRFDDLSYERIAGRLGIDVKEVEAHIAATLVAILRARGIGDSDAMHRSARRKPIRKSISG